MYVVILREDARCPIQHKLRKLEQLKALTHICSKSHCKRFVVRHLCNPAGVAQGCWCCKGANCIQVPCQSHSTIPHNRHQFSRAWTARAKWEERKKMPAHSMSFNVFHSQIHIIMEVESTEYLCLHFKSLTQLFTASTLNNN